MAAACGQARVFGAADLAAVLATGHRPRRRSRGRDRGLPVRKVGRLLRFKLAQVNAWARLGGAGNGGESSPVRLTNPPTREARARVSQELDPPAPRE